MWTRRNRIARRLDKRYACGRKSARPVFAAPAVPSSPKVGSVGSADRQDAKAIAALRGFRTLPAARLAARGPRRGTKGGAVDDTRAPAMKAFADGGRGSCCLSNSGARRATLCSSERTRPRCPAWRRALNAHPRDHRRTTAFWDVMRPSAAKRVGKRALHLTEASVMGGAPTNIDSEGVVGGGIIDGAFGIAITPFLTAVGGGLRSHVAVGCGRR